jgi:hypothetical protein
MTGPFGRLQDGVKSSDCLSFSLLFPPQFGSYGGLLQRVICAAFTLGQSGRASGCEKVAQGQGLLIRSESETICLQATAFNLRSGRPCFARTFIKTLLMRFYMLLKQGLPIACDLELKRRQATALQPRWRMFGLWLPTN